MLNVRGSKSPRHETKSSRLYVLDKLSKLTRQITFPANLKDHLQQDSEHTSEFHPATNGVKQANSFIQHAAE